MISRLIEQKCVGRMLPIEIDRARRWFGVRNPSAPATDITHHHS